MAPTLPLAQPYHVQRTEAKALPNNELFPWHRTLTALWHQKWRPLCVRAVVYPFADGNVEDFDPIFEGLIQDHNDDPSVLYDPDAYAKPFLPVGDDLAAKAAGFEKSGDTFKARELYLRAAAVFRIGRFPIPRSTLSKLAWEKGKEIYVKGSKYLDPPILPIDIPFKHANQAAGDAPGPIQVFLEIPKTEKPAAGYPVLLFICGLDAYRTDNTVRLQRHANEGGFACLVFEIPGTGDCPAAAGDPEGTERLVSSLLDWVEDDASTYGFDVSRICARGISTGGYHALRVAHTHGDRLYAVVAQGGGSHFMFDEAWINMQDQMEYPFALAEALALKFGYPSVEEYAKDSNAKKKFSLLEGTKNVLEMRSCKMLIINGMEDSIFPIEDSILVALHGQGKELVARANRRHMGEPGAEDMLHEWFANALKGQF